MIHCANPACSREFSPYPGKKFCSRKCNGQHNRRRVQEQHHQGTDCSATGALCELVVAADLMQKGYEVFRPLSPSAPCDLVVIKDQRILRIEVRKGHDSSKGIRFGKYPKDEGNQDHYAVVLTDRIVYCPDLP